MSVEDVVNMTPEEIRTAGLQVLAQALGPVGLVRFLQQFDNGRGNYAQDRHGWQDHLDVRSIVQQAQFSDK